MIPFFKYECDQWDAIYEFVTRVWDAETQSVTLAWSCLNQLQLTEDQQKTWGRLESKKRRIFPNAEIVPLSPDDMALCGITYCGDQCDVDILFEGVESSIQMMEHICASNMELANECISRYKYANEKYPQYEESFCELKERVKKVLLLLRSVFQE